VPDEPKTITVTWKNGDDVLETVEDVAEDATHAYDGATPEKSGDAQYSYVFKGWDDGVTDADGNVTYTAQFDAVVNKYAIHFVLEDGTKLQSGEVEYGAMPVYEGTPEKAEDGRANMAMVSFILKNTLSDNGGVTRGICLRDALGNLTGINETKNIVRTADGAGVEKENGVEPVDVESLVSMNFWGFFPPFLDELEAAFPAFLRSAGDYMKAEYLLPTSVDAMIKANTAAVKVLKSEDHWFGVTYHEDKQSVKDAFADLIARGVYDSPLDLVQR
jgi:hypothetical protein